MTNFACPYARYTGHVGATVQPKFGFAELAVASADLQSVLRDPLGSHHFRGALAPSSRKFDNILLNVTFLAGFTKKSKILCKERRNIEFFIILFTGSPN